MLRILFVGDFCPINRVAGLIRRGRSAEIYGDLLGKLADKDLSVVNLECPLTRRRSPIAKSGPNLRAHPRAVEALLAGGFDVACMANNHVADHGPKPVAETLALLARHRIRTVGAGMDLTDAQRPLRLRRNGKRIALLAFAENEFTCADERIAGAWPLDPLANIEQIRRARLSADVVIAMVHGGNEYNPFPTPQKVATYRAFAEAGASAVIGTHPHVPQGGEVHRGVPILYSLGNFVFDWLPGPETPMWSVGLAARLTFRDRGPTRVEIVGFRAEAQTACLQRLKGRQRQEFLAYLRFLSAPLARPAELRRYWDAWCAMKGPGVLGRLAGARRTDGRGFLTARNVLMCEAHHELACNYAELLRKKRLTEARRYVARVEALQQGEIPRRSRAARPAGGA